MEQGHPPVPSPNSGQGRAEIAAQPVLEEAQRQQRIEARKMSEEVANLDIEASDAIYGTKDAQIKVNNPGGEGTHVRTIKGETGKIDSIKEDKLYGNGQIERDQKSKEYRDQVEELFNEFGGRPGAGSLTKAKLAFDLREEAWTESEGATKKIQEKTHHLIEQGSSPENAEERARKFVEKQLKDSESKVDDSVRLHIIKNLGKNGVFTREDYEEAKKEFIEAGGDVTVPINSETEEPTEPEPSEPDEPVSTPTPEAEPTPEEPTEPTEFTTPELPEPSAEEPFEPQPVETFEPTSNEVGDRVDFANENGEDTWTEEGPSWDWDIEPPATPKDRLSRAWDRLKVGVGNVASGNVRITRRNAAMGAVAGALAGLGLWLVTKDHDTAHSTAHQFLATKNGETLKQVLAHNGVANPAETVAHLSNSGLLDGHGADAASQLARKTSNAQDVANTLIEKSGNAQDHRIAVGNEVQEILSDGTTYVTDDDSLSDAVKHTAGGALIGGTAAYAGTRNGQNHPNISEQQEAFTQEQRINTLQAALRNSLHQLDDERDFAPFLRERLSIPPEEWDEITRAWQDELFRREQEAQEEDEDNQ